MGPHVDICGNLLACQFTSGVYNSKVRHAPDFLQVFVAYHAQCCKGSGDYPAVGTPYVVYVVYGRCNVLVMSTSDEGLLARAVVAMLDSGLRLQTVIELHSIPGS